jgi:hypothetical protein
VLSLWEGITDVLTPDIDLNNRLWYNISWIADVREPLTKIFLQFRTTRFYI